MPDPSDPRIEAAAKAHATGPRHREEAEAVFDALTQSGPAA